MRIAALRPSLWPSHSPAGSRPRLRRTAPGLVLLLLAGGAGACSPVGTVVGGVASGAAAAVDGAASVGAAAVRGTGRVAGAAVDAVTPGDGEDE